MSSSARCAKCVAEALSRGATYNVEHEALMLVVTLGVSADDDGALCNGAEGVLKGRLPLLEHTL